MKLTVSHVGDPLDAMHAARLGYRSGEIIRAWLDRGFTKDNPYTLIVPLQAFSSSYGKLVCDEGQFYDS
jgi:hypothetical protein